MYAAPTEHNGDLGDSHQVPPSQPVGIYGWRKRCVYAFILILMAVVIVNIALTVWILKVLRVSLDGVDGLKFVPEGVRFSKETVFSKPVYADRIYSTKDKSLYLMSNKDIHLITKDNDTINSQLVVGPRSVEATCDKFTVQDAKGFVRMEIEGDSVVLGTKDASYPGDIHFGSSVSTPTVRSPLKKALRVESTTSKVHIMGTGGVVVNSDAGDVILRAKSDVYLSSTGGDVHIQSQNIYMKNLPATASSSRSTFPAPQSSLSLSSSSSSSSSSTFELYQLCLCASGKLYRAPARGNCGVNPSICGHIYP